MPTIDRCGAPSRANPGFENVFGPIFKRSSLPASLDWGIRRTQKMLDFFAPSTTSSSDVNIDIQNITTYERLLKSDGENIAS